MFSFQTVVSVFEIDILPVLTRFSFRISNIKKHSFIQTYVKIKKPRKKFKFCNKSLKEI